MFMYLSYHILSNKVLSCNFVLQVRAQARVRKYAMHPRAGALARYPRNFLLSSFCREMNFLSGYSTSNAH